MPTEIQEYSQTEAALTDLRDRYEAIKYEVSDANGLKEAKNGRAEIRGYRINLEKMRKDIKAPALERCRLIDAEAKRITEELLYLESPIDAQIKEEESRKEKEREAKIQVELKRVEDIQDRLEDLRSAALAFNRTSQPSPEKVAELINDIEKCVVDDSFDEFEQRAHEAKASTLAFLRELLAAAKEREAEEKRIQFERAELAELRAAEDKRQAEAEKKRQVEEKKQREELAAQKKNQDAAQKKIDDENARLVKERADLEREQRKEADRKAAEEKAEQGRKATAQAAAKKARYPGEQAIVDALTEYFGVPPEVVMTWLTELRKAA